MVVTPLQANGLSSRRASEAGKISTDKRLPGFVVRRVRYCLVLPKIWEKTCICLLLVDSL